jgi:hypothetical protein
MFLDLPSLFFEDLLIFVYVLDAVDTELVHMDYEHLRLLSLLETEEKASNRVPPQLKCRRMWPEIRDKFSDTVFRRMFRMSKESYYEILCLKIVDEVGEEQFKPCDYLMSKGKTLQEKCTTFHGGVISGELKLAMAIRMLAGASYLDLLDTYDVGPVSIYASFHHTISWINQTFDFVLHRMLAEKDADGLQRIADSFSTLSNGVFGGILGALDGVAVKIRCPSSTRDGVVDVGNYFCRKGFHAFECASHLR